jgi:hypothetical protein
MHRSESTRIDIFPRAGDLAGGNWYEVRDDGTDESVQIEY